MDMKLFYDGAIQGIFADGVQLVEEFMGQCEYVVIGTVTENVGVRLSALSNFPGQTIKELWFATDLVSPKARNLSVRPECEIMMTNGEGQLMMGGTMEIVTDATLKKEKWQPGMEQHFGGPEAENYCLLKFTPSYIRVMLV